MSEGCRNGSLGSGSMAIVSSRDRTLSGTGPQKSPQWFPPKLCRLQNPGCRRGPSTCHLSLFQMLLLRQFVDQGPYRGLPLAAVPFHHVGIWDIPGARASIYSIAATLQPVPSFPTLPSHSSQSNCPKTRFDAPLLCSQFSSSLTLFLPL